MDKVGLKDEAGKDGVLVRSITVFVSQYKERVVLVPGLGRTGQAMKMKFSVVLERQKKM